MLHHPKIALRQKWLGKVCNGLWIERHGLAEIPGGRAHNLLDCTSLQPVERRTADARFRSDQPLPGDAGIGDHAGNSQHTFDGASIDEL